MKRSLSCLLLLAILLSLLTLSAPADVIAAGNQPSTYSDASNSGTRDVVCTTLSGTGAADYYTGSYTYATLSGQSESALLQSLRKLMTDTHKKNSSYADCKNMATKTDCQNENGKIVLIYTSKEVTFDDFKGGNGWNREHVWPKSLGGYETSGAGADLHHIRPSDNKVNGTRGNKKYGNVDGGNPVKGGSLVGNMVGGHSSGSYFEPLDNVKGDLARICLYMYVRYGGDSRYSCSKITTIFQSVDVLLEWMELDPVDTWEMGRNEVVEAYQGNRNVFIDYPEYAWLLFGEAVPANMTTPSGSKGSTVTPTETTAPPVTETTAPPVTETTAPPVTETTAPPVTETTAPPVTETTAPPVTETTAPPATETTAPVETETTVPPTTESTVPPTTEGTTTTTPATGPVSTESVPQPPAPAQPEPGSFVWLNWVLILAIVAAGTAAVIVVIYQIRKKD